MYTLETVIQEWDAAGQHGDAGQRTRQAERWLPYYAFIAKRQRNMPFAFPEEPDEFVAGLLRDGLLRPEDTVLDIGAGTGGYALELAPHCRRVTALELSADCLDLLKAHADACGLENIRTVNTAWEHYETAERFDLVFSSMCPAICNVEELRRMEALSKRACCLITVGRGSYDKHRRAMMEALDIRPKGGMVTEAIHYYNALYLMGRQPNVACRTLRQTFDIPEAAVLEQYPVYFRIFGVEEDRATAFLKQYLAEHADHGVLHDESVIHQVMITWEIEANKY